VSDTNFLPRNLTDTNLEYSTIDNPPGEAPGDVPDVPGARAAHLHPRRVLHAPQRASGGCRAEAAGAGVHAEFRADTALRYARAVPEYAGEGGAGEWSALVLMTSFSVRILLENDDFGWRNCLNGGTFFKMSVGHSIESGSGTVRAECSPPPRRARLP
jgi:hypothetical protein